MVPGATAFTRMPRFAYSNASDLVAAFRPPLVSDASTEVQAGNILDVSAPAPQLYVATGERPVVLVSAGIGATPVLAMPHALAAEQSRREICWAHGARNQQRASLCGGGARTPRDLARQPQPHLLQCAKANRSA
jgi:ferredoxin-NADP reductase